MQHFVVIKLTINNRILKKLKKGKQNSKVLISVNHKLPLHMHTEPNLSTLTRLMWLLKLLSKTLGNVFFEHSLAFCLR